MGCHEVALNAVRSTPLAKAPLVELRGITKTFGSIRANDGIDLDLIPGEIHALLGANGAGKSTLMSILSGAYALDSGMIRVRGRAVRFRSPSDALQAGIGMVHQHVMLIPSMTVSENLAVGDGTIPWVVRYRSLAAQVSALAERLGFEISPIQKIAELSIAQRQQVEIMRNLARDVAVLILDEPTAALTPQETEGLFGTLRGLSDGGASVVFISHKLDEVMAVAHRVTVLREGRVAYTATATQCTPAGLVAHMMGRGEEQKLEAPVDVTPDRPVAELRAVAVMDPWGTRALRGVSLQAFPGEILGVGGLAGAGQTALAEVLAGLRVPSAGSAIIGDEDLTGRPVRDFHRQGVRYVPADRRNRGLASDLTLADNAVLTWLSLARLGHGAWLSRSAVRLFGTDLARSEGIEPGDPGRPARLLSGGNMQKLIVGRETRESPRVLIAEYPLRGLDIGATWFVKARLLSLASAGTAIILISEDLDELLSLSHRILVLARGQVVAERRPADTTRLELGLDMTGQGASAA